MLDALSIALIGQYATPRYNYGDTVTDVIRGDVVIAKTTDAPIPWPMGKLRGSRKSGLVIFDGLLIALRTESASAICHHWSVTPQTVSKWRRLLGIESTTPGSTELRKQRLEPRGDAMRAKIDRSSSARNAKIAAAKRGKLRPIHVRDALLKANVGRALSREHRRKIGDGLRRAGVRPPKARRPWTAEEDVAPRTCTATDTARITGRTLPAVYTRRHQLGLPDGRR